VLELTPNVNGLLRRWGILAKSIGGIELSGVVEQTSTGAKQKVTDLTGAKSIWQHPWELVETASLLKKLRDITINGDDNNAHSTLHKSVTVKTVDPEAGQILLDDGTQVEADIIVVADGIHV